MNELDMIRGLLDEAPPSAEVFAEGRRRIAAESAQPRQPRARWALAGTGLVAAAAAAIAAFTLAPAAGPPSASPKASITPTISRHPHFGPATTAAGVLHNAALAALQIRARTPRPDQFVYTKVYTTDTTRSGGPGVIQEWISVSGARFGLAKGGWRSPARGWQLSACAGGRIKQAPGAPPYSGSSRCTQAASAGYFPNLPTGDSAALARYLDRTFQIHSLSADDNSAQLMDLIESLTEHDYLTPAQRGAMYNMLAQAHGLTVVHHVRNILGVPGVGVRTTFTDKGAYDTIIFDPRSYAALGMIEQLPHGGGTTGEVQLKQAIVDKAGELP